MVTTDFSSTDRAVVAAAVALAERLGIPSIALFHAHASPTLTDFGVSEPLGRTNEMRAPVEKRLAEWSAELSTARVKLEPFTIEGRPPHAIIACSRDYDLIIMASRGGGGLRDFLLGSTTDRVVRGAACDVWIVRVSPSA